MNRSWPQLHRLNVAYLGLAAELCRAQPRQARLRLHLSDDEVRVLGQATILDWPRFDGFPLAIMRPHPRLVDLVQTSDPMRLIAGVQAAMLVSSEGQAHG